MSREAARRFLEPRFPDQPPRAREHRVRGRTRGHERRSVAAQFVGRLRAEEPRHSEAPSHGYERGFSEKQARAILATRKPNSLSRESLFREWVALAIEMAQLEEPLNAPRALDAIIHAERTEFKARYNSPRRTQAGSLWP